MEETEAFKPLLTKLGELQITTMLRQREEKPGLKSRNSEVSSRKMESIIFKSQEENRV